MRSPDNVGRAVQKDPTLLRYASAITENKKCCWLKRSTRGFQTLRSNNSNNMQQHVQTDTNYNIQQCLQGALKKFRVYERVLLAKCQVRIRIECRGFAAKGANLACEFFLNH